ncbi:Centrosomal protein of 152 kDa [Larimichthys crocea]|uniref:Uncharacterized protein n=1 Tax=Larimichthys crocea TaxID=215358 RepID=A0ACD3QFK8_LARCR|nr:Centrosomal protein of 152 kDa [Larimichthys crocea]
MSIDFDSAALQTQHDEEEYDQEDYAREQELQKLLTDLPDDMLEDSRDSSSPELEYSACSNKNTGNRTMTLTMISALKMSTLMRMELLRSTGITLKVKPLPHTWNQQPQDQFAQGDYTYTSMGTEQSTETNDFSTDEYEPKPYPQSTKNAVVYNGEGGRRDNQNYGDHNNARNHFHPKMFNTQAAHQEGQLDHLQREFLDSTQQTADREQLAQLQILNKAQQRQIEDLERKLEDSRRNMRYAEHQLAIVKDEKDGLAVSLKESSRLVEEAKGREAQMQNKFKAMEQQLKVLTERDQENTEEAEGGRSLQWTA